MELFPVLNTNRLVLRKITADDISSLVKYANNRKISDHILNIPYPYDEPNAVFRISYVVQGFKNKTRYIVAIALKDTGEFIGESGLHLDNAAVAQLGYWVGEPFWNQGIASEAIAAVFAFGFDQLQLEKIYATCHEENAASIKVLQKNRVTKKNINGSVIQYWMTRADYTELLSADD